MVKGKAGKKNARVSNARASNTARVIPRRPRNVQQIPRPMASSNRSGVRTSPAHVQHHMLATHCPFDPRSKGARTPSEYGIATNVHTSTVSYTLTTTAGGVLDAIVLPHPVYSVCAGYSTVSGGVSTGDFGTGGVSVQPVRGNVSVANLSSSYTNYRVVAWGVRLKPLQSYTGASGRIYCANIPSNPQLPLISSSTGTIAKVWDALSVPYDGTGVSDQLLNYPRSSHFNGAELVSEGGVELRPQFTGPGHEHFRESSILDEQRLVTSNALGVITGGVSLGFGDVSGMSSIVIRGDGMTASTAVALLEVIYHLEGTPKISTNPGAMVPASPTPPPTPNAAQHLSTAISSLASSTFVTYISDKVRQEGSAMARRNLPAPMAGLAERMIGLGLKELPSAIEYGASMLPFLL